MARYHFPPASARVGAALVSRGFLAPEPRLSRADVILIGGAFRYTLTFWQHVGALGRGPGGCGWRLQIESPESLSGAGQRVADAWVAAGAPAEFAATEGVAAVNALVAHGPCASLVEAPPG